MVMLAQVAQEQIGACRPVASLQQQVKDDASVARRGE